jgi:acid phosphatase class B
MYTAHAQARCQQRSIPSEVVDALLSYGERRRHRGADVYYLTKAARTRASGALGTHYRRMEKALNSYIVVADDGQVITAGHRYRRLKF